MANRTVPSFGAILTDNLFSFAVQLSREHFGEQAQLRAEQRADEAQIEMEDAAENEKQWNAALQQLIPAHQCSGQWCIVCGYNLRLLKGGVL